MSILIVGASVAGIRTAQALRGHGYRGAVTVLEAESHHPYDKPPLSKELLIGAGVPVPLLSPDDVSALDIDLRLGVRADAVDTDRRVVDTSAGEFRYESLVVATGLRPRTLPGAAELSGVHTLRGADDAVALRAALPRARQVVVVGAGFIGAEFASAAVKYGCQVTIVEAAATPLTHILGAEVGAEIARLHELNGVRLYTGAQVEHFTGTEAVDGVVLADGRALPADLVVIGIGAVPATEWLQSSGLPLENGLRCEENGRVPGFPDIYAVGDIALRQHPIYGSALRIEHWTNAGELAAVAAAAIVGAPAPAPQLPYVWSDQYGHRIQIIGRPVLGTLATCQGTVSDGRFVAAYADQDGIAVGAVVVDDPRTLMTCRRAITRRQPEAELERSMHART